jgi:hypothetical protein
MSHQQRSVRAIPGIGLAMALLWAGSIQAAPIFEHAGSADPLTEGFGYWPWNGGISTASIPDDAGEQAWQVTSTSSPAQAVYIQLGGTGPYLGGSGLTQDQVDAINADGFVLSMRARVISGPVYDVDGSQHVCGSISVAGFSGFRFDIALGSDGSGNTVVVTPELVQQVGSHFSYHPFGSAILVPGNGYHLYQLSYDPLSTQADLWIDGELVASGYQGSAVSGGAVANNYGLGFGALNLATINFAEARLESGQLAGGPSPVPDGRLATTPLLLDRLTDTGSVVGLTWDVVSCTATDYDVLFGPLASVASYDLLGAVCGAGNSGSYVWNGVPDGDLFVLMVGTDGGSVESSWGRDSLGVERNGVATSGLCDVTVKDASEACP